VTLVHWTGYIEAVEHTFEVDKQARIHTGSVFRLARVSFSKGSSDYYTPTDNPDQPLTGDEPRPTDAPPVTPSMEQAMLKSVIKKGVGENSRHVWLREFAEQARPVCLAANFPLSLCLAQATLESQWGEKHIGKANNYFGIKASAKEKSVKAATHEEINGKSTPVTSSFKVFASQQACVQGYVEKMTRAGSAWIPPAGAASSVQARMLWIWAGASYATARHYMSSLRSVSKQIAEVLGDASLEIKFNVAQLALEKEMVALDAWISTKPTGIIAETYAAVIKVFSDPQAPPPKYINIYPRKTRANQIRAAGQWPA
jgi:flagellum-specific peptidoglycan hydrolase FlgJ